MATRERPVTQPDVAKLAGVSRGLVSQALSGDGRMSPSTRARILETAEQLGYYPHSAASELAGGHSKRLVLILPYLTNPYFDELSSHLRVAASARGYSLIVMVSDLLSHGADLAQYVVGASTRSSPSPTHSSRSARFPRRWVWATPASRSATRPDRSKTKTMSQLWCASTTAPSAPWQTRRGVSGLTSSPPSAPRWALTT